MTADPRDYYRSNNPEGVIELWIPEGMSSESVQEFEDLMAIIFRRLRRKGLKVDAEKERLAKEIGVANGVESIKTY